MDKKKLQRAFVEHDHHTIYQMLIRLTPESLFGCLTDWMLKDRVDVFLLLIQNQINIHFQNKHGETLLHIAAYKGLESMIVLLVRWGIDVNAKDGQGRTALCLACKQKKTSIVWLLLQCGANPEYTYDEPLPIRIAFQHRHIDHIRALLSLPLSCIPLHEFLSNDKVLELCIQRYPQFMSVTDRFGDTILHRIVDKGSLETLKMVLSYGPDLSVCNYHGETPLQLARAKNKQSMIQILECY